MLQNMSTQTNTWETREMFAENVRHVYRLSPKLVPTFQLACIIIIIFKAFRWLLEPSCSAVSGRDWGLTLENHNWLYLGIK